MIDVLISPFIAFVIARRVEKLAAVIYHRPIFMDGEAYRGDVKALHCSSSLSSRATFGRLQRLFAA